MNFHRERQGVFIYVWDKARFRQFFRRFARDGPWCLAFFATKLPFPFFFSLFRFLIILVVGLTVFLSTTIPTHGTQQLATSTMSIALRSCVTSSNSSVWDDEMGATSDQLFFVTSYRWVKGRSHVANQPFDIDDRCMIFWICQLQLRCKYTTSPLSLTPHMLFHSTISYYHFDSWKMTVPQWLWQARSRTQRHRSEAPIVRLSFPSQWWYFGFT